MKTIEELKDFEQWVIDSYIDKKIKSPVHLSGSKDDVQEKRLIEIFKDIRPQDWVFTTYRSHYHCLLKGVPEQWLKEWILDNKSIHVMNKEHKIVSSAIVGGTLSQAVGVAMAIKKKKQDNIVYCFIGDMTATLGTFNDCLNYSILNKLPITFIIEDNGLSTDTPTHEAWNIPKSLMDIWLKNTEVAVGEYVIYYKYERIHPHYGINDSEGKRVIVNFNDIVEEMET